MVTVAAVQKLSAAAQAALRALTNLRRLEAKLLLTPDLLTTLQPLHALTHLLLVMCQCYGAANSAMTTGTVPLVNGWRSRVSRESTVVVLLMTTHGCNHLTQEDGNTQEALESYSRRHPHGWASLRKLQLPLRYCGHTSHFPPCKGSGSMDVAQRHLQT